MNISNSQQYINAAAFMPKLPSSGSETELNLRPAKDKEKTEELKVNELRLPGSKKSEDENEHEDPKAKMKALDDLVMKPSPLSLEERMSQVISPEQVRDLLSLIARFPVQSKDEKHNLDVKR
ncbi:hypothetical protein [Leptospira sp. GIMC2001]|uniref:hypothetical protein n=1 Tax=Leptospira sp. GIMC2001 TaxID=1513297 RepID=UPI00234A9DCE|nr:hypothetical protein [Leptospira sp. GIMC2001]WCL51428.1 hypothetical protein O4O04_05600 [Leptospira sp. GIMC2001]